MKHETRNVKLLPDDPTFEPNIPYSMPLLTFEDGTDELYTDQFPLFVRRTSTLRGFNLLGVWDEWLVFQPAFGNRDGNRDGNFSLILVDSNGREVSRLPNQVDIQRMVGVYKDMAIMKSIWTANTCGPQTFAYSKTGRSSLLRDVPDCSSVWKERLVTGDGMGKIELWEWKDLSEVHLTRTHQFNVHDAVLSTMGLRNSLLIATYDRGILECSIDGDVTRVISHPSGGTGIQLLEWRGFTLTVYYEEGYVWDEGWNLLRTIPRYDSTCVWNDELLCCDSNSYYEDYRVMSIHSWKPNLHHRYPRKNTRCHSNVVDLLP